MNRDQLPIAEPCDANWDGMDSHGAARFCDSCAKSVHDLSAMTERAAKTLLTEEKNLCVRYTHTPDGRIKHRSEMPSMLERGLRNGLRIGLGLTLVAGGPVFASTAARSTEGDADPGVIEMALELLESLLEEVPGAVLMGEPMAVEAVEPVLMGKPMLAEPEERVVMGGPMLIEPEALISMGDVEYVPEALIEEPEVSVKGEVAYEPAPAEFISVEPGDDPTQLKAVVSEQ